MTLEQGDLPAGRGGGHHPARKVPAGGAKGRRTGLDGEGIAPVDVERRHASIRELPQLAGGPKHDHAPLRAVESNQEPRKVPLAGGNHQAGDFRPANHRVAYPSAQFGYGGRSAPSGQDDEVGRLRFGLADDLNGRHALHDDGPWYGRRSVRRLPEWWESLGRIDTQREDRKEPGTQPGGHLPGRKQGASLRGGILEGDNDPAYPHALPG